MFSLAAQRDGEAGTNEHAMNMINEDAERHRIEALLPWYAAGTLSRSDTDRVEQALAGDSELVRCYALVLEELAETIDLNETLAEPSACVAEKLFAAIDAEEVRAPRRRLHRLGQTLPSAPASPT